jgi:type I restriction enzyme S subunit
MKEGWQIKTLDELCEIFGRIGYRGYTKNDLVSTPEEGAITLSPTNIIDGELHYDKCSYITWEKYEESPEIMVFEGDIVLVKTASIGKCALVRNLPHKATLNPQFVVLKKLKANNQYLTYFLQSPIAQKKFQEYAIGTAIPTFSQKKLGTLEVPVPPLSEQQRIVNLLDAEFAKIDTLKASAERNLQNAKDLFCSIQTKVLENKSWKRYTLDDVCNLITDGTHRTPQYLQQGIPFLSVKNITGGFLDLDDTKFISEREHKELIKRCKPEKGDVLYSKVGTTGVAQLIDTDKEFSIFVSLALLKVKQEIIKNTLLVKILNSPYVREQAKKRTRGTANKNFVISDIKAVEVLIPPYNEQEVIEQTIDTYWSKVSSLQANYEKTIALCDDLKQALLGKAFNGEL